MRRYWKLKGDALARLLWTTCFGRGCGYCIGQTADWLNEWMNVALIVLNKMTSNRSHINVNIGISVYLTLFQ